MSGRQMNLLGRKLKDNSLLQSRGRNALARVGCGWLYLLSLTCVVIFQMGVSLIAFTGENRWHSSSRSTASHVAASDKNYHKTALQVEGSIRSETDNSAVSIGIKRPTRGKTGGPARKLYALDLRRNESSKHITSTTNSSLIHSENQLYRPKLLRNGTKPKIVLLAGPYKTGSSFLQCAFSREGYDLLRRDNYFYLGTCSFECRRMRWDYEFCEKHSQGSFFVRNLVDPLFAEKINELYAKRQNAIIVWEYLSDLHPERMLSLMEALDGWDVQVILMYRRLFSWLPSWYGQKHRPIPGREQLSIWPDQSVVPRGSRVRKSGAVRFPFDVYTKQQRRANGFDGVYSASASAIESTGLHPVEQARRYWRKHVNNITVVSLHHLPKDQGTGDPLFTHLFCNVIPMNHTCQASMANVIGHMDEGTNERFPENYDTLAVFAHQRGLHPGGDAKLSRPEVWRAIRLRQESVLNKTSNEFPLTCISNRSLEILFNYSVSAERVIFPGLEEEHRLEFLEAVQSKKFCSIDAERTIGHSDWRDFFRPFVSLIPHIAERDNSGSWTPEWKPNQPLQKLYFTGLRPHQPNVPSMAFLGIMSVSGAGSTLLHQFFRQSKTIFSLSRLLMESTKVDHSSLACIYGMSASLPTQVTGANQTSCRVMRYVQLVETWASSLPHLSNTEPAALQVSFTPVTMIEEPFDRWVSMFHAFQNRQPRLGDPLHSLHQLAFTGDLEGFLRHLSSLPFRSRTLEMLDSYQYTSADVNRAIDTIEGNTPRVLVLIHECVELSMRLLSAHFPALVSRESVDEFLQNAVTNRTAVSHPTRASGSGRLRDNVTSSVSGDGNSEADDASYDLRERAREWFALDYRYYDAAVSRFLRLLQQSGITNDGTAALSCLPTFGGESRSKKKSH